MSNHTLGSKQAPKGPEPMQPLPAAWPWYTKLPSCTRCVKCAEPHLTADCLRLRDNTLHSPLKCANCSGEHTANYKGCPKFKKNKLRMQTLRNRIKTQTTSPLSRNENLNQNRQFTRQQNEFPPPLPGTTGGTHPAQAWPTRHTPGLYQLKNLYLNSRFLKLLFVINF